MNSSSFSQESLPQLGFRFTDPAEPEPELPAAKTAAARRRVWTVGELVGEVRSHVERVYADCWVEGEISNLRSAPSGHLYFTLKDGDAQLPIVLFRKQATLLRFRPEDGLQVVARGKVSVYEQRGQMQLVAETLEPVGIGSLQVAFEQLKVRLGAEGLFAEERKRPLPMFPRCVGIVTSPAGAVIRDFLNVTNRRFAALHVLLHPAVVQGDSAAAEIAAGILYFNQTRCVDVIVVARGGGSLEDLAPFNSELLARAIARSELPVVSAVGHETDFTIADFVADLRAPTPSAAAELITSALHRVEDRVDELHLRMTRAVRYRMMMANERYGRVAVAASFARLQDALGRKQQRVDELQYRLERIWRQQHGERCAALQDRTDRLLRQDVSRHLRESAERIMRIEGRMARAHETLLQRQSARLATLTARLESMSPTAVLHRGYALVFREDGALLRDAAQTALGESITTRLAAGTLKSQITGKSA